MNILTQMMKIKISEIVFKLILKNLNYNILISLTALLKNLYETTAICLDFGLIITLALIKLIPQSC